MSKKNISFLGLTLILVSSCYANAVFATKPPVEPIVVYTEYVEGIAFKHIVLSDGTRCIFTESQAGSISATHSVDCKL